MGAAEWHQINKFGEYGKVAYNLITISTLINTNTWAVFSTFPWIYDRNSDHYDGYATFYIEIGNRDADIRLYDATNGTVLGTMTNISATGFYSFAITNPTTDALLELHVKKSTMGGQNPQIHSAYIEYKI